MLIYQRWCLQIKDMVDSLGLCDCRVLVCHSTPSHLDMAYCELMQQKNATVQFYLPIRAGFHVELLLRGGHVVGGVKWADLEVGACMVLPALHQVELKRDIQGI